MPEPIDPSDAPTMRDWWAAVACRLGWIGRLRLYVGGALLAVGFMLLPPWVRGEADAYIGGALEDQEGGDGGGGGAGVTTGAGE